MERSVPIPTLHLFPVLDELLIDLLRSLSPEDWNKPTLAKQWMVKDIAAHLLDTNMRAVAGSKGYTPPPPQNINSYQELVAYLNDLNAVWVKAMQRIAPTQLIDLLESTGKQYRAYISTLDPFGPARYGVSWAGEDHSTNWFDIAREYTEKWHHQQQIRDAVGKTDALMNRELFYPCIDTFMCGLPHAYRNVKADNGTLIQFTISGEAGGNWYLKKTEDSWQLTKVMPESNVDASVTIPPDVSWKLFTKGISREAAIEKSIVSGDQFLAENIFGMVSVMA
ncbi:MAG TPA: maleylpyruvate isomerase N-terminal domain-containing protein [Mucilaginibacter sp.]|nr:maleylpyruvate isomerase N-terminal domain-containing protein [Mucilaginibacter sp.]